MIRGSSATSGITNAQQTSVVAAGTAYALTATAAAVVFGTTSPTITLPAAGTYLIFARAKLDYAAATFAAVRTATLKLTRTNNTPADLTGSSTGLATQILTALTFTMPPALIMVLYTTSNANDAIALYGSLDVVPTAGNLNVTEASIVAIRLQQ